MAKRFVICILLLFLAPTVLPAQDNVTASAPVPEEVAGAPYDESALTALPGGPEVSSGRRTAAATTAVADVGTYGV